MEGVKLEKEREREKTREMRNERSCNCVFAGCNYKWCL